ncbi:MAG: hypothetical protein ACYSUV_21605, partial [Planctomycetota bacterium]
MESNRVEDQSGDHKYFIVTPQLVWALCDGPYEYTLWNVIKMIAGDCGECMLSTDDLAAAAMMSAGKASQCRTTLLEQGLLKGEVRRDPGYPQPVWHLTVPNLWKANIEWRERHPSLKDRIRLKREQKRLHQVKASPGEGGTSPGEGGTSPGETKKNQKDNQSEPEEPAAPDSFLDAIASGKPVEVTIPGVAFDVTEEDLEALATLWPDDIAALGEEPEQEEPFYLEGETPTKGPEPRTAEQVKAGVQRALEAFAETGGCPGVADPTQDDEWLGPEREF